MKPMLVFPAGTTEAIRFASEALHRNGIALIDHPTPEITHLLLDVPSFGPDGNLRSGRNPQALLERVPEDVTIIGGNLAHPLLSSYGIMDLLADERYLARNAAITADCAIRVAAPLLKSVFPETPTLVIGWGRIGKCLAQLLKAMDVPVTVAARKEKDRAALLSLGYSAMDLRGDLKAFRLIFNTVPEVVFPDEIEESRDCVKIDLASRKGLSGEGVVAAKGLPGLLAPESSGKLIARTILRIMKEETL